MVGFECTISVADIDAAIRAIEVNGGRMAAPKFHIPTVGTSRTSSTRKGTSPASSSRNQTRDRHGVAD
jgi:predicted enzyme related to lactoylglutathione lyase